MDINDHSTMFICIIKNTLPPPSPTPKKEIKDGKWLYIHHFSKKTCTKFPKSLKFTSTRLKLLFISVFDEKKNKNKILMSVRF